ncbi:AraC family transcriptional regulator [Frateuria aurantia]
MDPLSDVLSLLKLRSYVSGGFDAAGEWGVRFGAHDGIKFHAVLNGECWLILEGHPQPVKIRKGECFLLAHGRPFRLTSHIGTAAVDVAALLPANPDGRIVTYQDGGEFLSIGGYFTLADGPSEWLLEMLPALIHIRDNSAPPILHWCIERMRRELHTPLPGGDLVAQQLATMVLVEALRWQLATGAGTPQSGWLFALADKRIRFAIQAMHAEPARRWTIASMAHEAAMSRTAFALKFKALVGITPMDYLARWRMARAAERLVHSTDSLAEIALALGYESEKSFSTAFKRLMQCSPRQYGRKPENGHRLINPTAPEAT